MEMDENHRRLNAALQSANLYDALQSLALAFKSEGMDQLSMYRLFREYLNATDAAEPRRDPICDTMDLIWGGGWAKGRQLFDKPLTHDDVA